MLCNAPLVLDKIQDKAEVIENGSKRMLRIVFFYQVLANGWMMSTSAWFGKYGCGRYSAGHG
ncbi:MAG: hypothetical protein JRD69_05445 [Deltaproteobacteria bacterium]|nr:hypothetical protein [Deltaproteobacteria bacterium]